MRFISIISLLLLTSFFCTYGQGRGYADSLLTRLSAASEDTNKVKLLVAITKACYDRPDEGIKYAQQAIDLAQKLGWDRGVASANSSMGQCYQAKANYSLSLTYYLKSLEISEKLGDKDQTALNFGEIGNLYWYESDFPKSLDNYFKALKIYEELNDKKGIAKILDNIGEVYAHQNDYDKALEYYSKSLDINQAINNKYNIARNLGEMGEAYVGKRNYQKALECNLKSLNIFEELGDKYGIANNKGTIGGAYQSQKNYAMALKYYFEALRLVEEINDQYGSSIGLGNIGETYLDIAKDTVTITRPDSLIPAGRAANLRKSIEYLTRAITAFKKLGVLDAVLSYSQGLSEAYRLSGDYKSALESYMQYATLNDSVNSNTNKVKIAKLEAARELGLKEKQLEIDKLEVAKERNERALLIASIVLLLMVIIFIFRNYKTQKKSNELLSEEKKRSDDLLLNILPAEVADELKATGGAVAKYFDDVTVMFTDFVNFTQAGERMNPQQLIDELHTCFKAFDEIVDKYNIEKIKTIGDAYLAVSGLPVADRRHAELVVKAAIDINEFMLRRKKQMGSKTFEVRIGIHTGSVVAGIVGVKKFAYDIWGDTVNTAARMEENSEAGKINISQTTYELVQDKFDFIYRGEIEAKNKGDMKMYFVANKMEAV